MRKVAVAGVGAVGSTVVDKLIEGIDGLSLVAVSNLRPTPQPVPNIPLSFLPKAADIIVECLPAEEAGSVVRSALKWNKIVICISSSALLSDPDILKIEAGELIIPSGAIAGIDGLNAMRLKGDEIQVTIKTTKKPAALMGAPYVKEQNLSLEDIAQAKTIFQGNAIQAAKGFPANVNVAATLALNGSGPVETQVEIIADPNIPRTCHEIIMKSSVSEITVKVENMPDPANPKSSQLTALSILSELEKLGRRQKVY